MSFDYAHSINNISSFVKNINDNNGQSHVMGRNSNNEHILVRFINAITMNVCDKQKLEQLFTELHVLIKVDYGISITTMNIFEKYDELKQIVEATLSTILKVGSCLKNVDNQSNQQADIEKQCILLLEILPTLFYCHINMQKKLNTNKIDTSIDSRVKGGSNTIKIWLSKVVKVKWKPFFILPSLLMIGEMQSFLDLSDWIALHEQLLSSTFIPNEYPSIIKCILNFITSSLIPSKDITKSWINTFRKLLIKSFNMSISANVFLICRISMEQSPKLCERLIHYYLQLRNGASESNVTWVDIALIFLVAHNYSSNDSLIAVLMSAKSRQQIYLQQYENGLINNKNSSKSKKRIKLSSATVNVETVNPSEDDGMLIADTPVVWLSRQCITGILMIVASKAEADCENPYTAMYNFCRTLLHDGGNVLGADFSISIIPELIQLCTALISLKSDAMPRWQTKKNITFTKTMQSLGCDILFLMFELYQECQPNIIDLAFHNLLSKDFYNEKTKKSVHRVYLRLLVKLGSQRTIMFGKHILKVQDWLGYVFGPSVSYTDARSILSSVIPLVKYSKDFADFILMRLRKMTLNRRSGNNQYLAIDGLCMLLQYSSLMGSNVHMEIVEIMRSVMFISLDMRSRLLSCLNLSMQRLLNQNQDVDKPANTMMMMMMDPSSSARNNPGNNNSSSSTLSSSSSSSSSSILMGVNTGTNKRVDGKWPLSRNATGILTGIIWQRLLALCDQDISSRAIEDTGDKNPRAIPRKKIRNHGGRFNENNVELTINTSKIFRILKVQDKKIYEQVESPGLLFNCLLSLVNLANVNLINLNPIVYSFLSYLHLDDGDMNGQNVSRLEEYKTPLMPRVKILVPLSTAVAQFLFVTTAAANGNNNLEDNTRAYMDHFKSFLSKYNADKRYSMLIELYEVAGILNILCQPKYDMGAVTRLELIDFNEYNDVFQPIGCKEVQTSLFVFKQFFNNYLAQDSNGGFASNATKTREIKIPTSIIATLHASKNLLQQVTEWEKEPSSMLQDSFEKIFLDSVSAVLLAYAATSFSVMKKNIIYYAACYNFILKSYNEETGPFCNVVRRCIKANVKDESNVSNLSFLELLFKKEKPKSKDIQKLFMKDTGVSTIFFELRINLLKILEKMLNLLTTLLLRPNKKAFANQAKSCVSKFSKFMDCSIDTLEEEESVVKFIFISLGVAFGKQVPKDMKTKLGTHPTLIWLNISIMNYCIKINNQLSNENLVLYKIVAPEYVAMICNYKVDNTKVLKEILEFILNAGYMICNKSNMEIPERLPSALIRASMDRKYFAIFEEQTEGDNKSTSKQSLFKSLIDQISHCSFEKDEGSKATLLIPFQHYQSRLKGLLSGKDDRIACINKSFKNKNKKNDTIGNSNVGVNEKIHRLIDGAGASIQMLNMKERRSILHSIEIIIEDMVGIFSHDVSPEVCDSIMNITNTNFQLSNLETIFRCFQKDNWKPKLLQKSYSHLMPVFTSLATLGRVVCQIIIKFGYRVVGSNKSNKKKQHGSYEKTFDSIWLSINRLYRLFILSRHWITLLTSFHSHIKKKCSETLMAIEKFDMEIWNMCISHERYIFKNRKDRSWNLERYHMEFAVLVVDVIQIRNIIDRMKNGTKENNGMMLLERQRSARKGGKRKGRKKKRLRSRNKYVDTHLESESGDDAYADLEDFIVGEDDEID